MLLFETERLTVRRLTETDADHFFQLNGDSKVLHFIRPAKTREESDIFLAENIAMYSDSDIAGRYIVFEKNTNAFAGTFSYLYLADNIHVHIGYALVPDAWGKGYATELVRTGTPYFFSKTDQFYLSGITHKDNGPSQRVLLKCGYDKRGYVEEHGEILDLFVVERP